MESYLSLDDILASQVKVSCVLLDRSLVGLLDRGGHGASGRVKLELPCWLVGELVALNAHAAVVEVDTPKVYQQNKRDMLAADATRCNLHRDGPYFYTCGLQLLDMGVGERAPLAACLAETLLTRLIWLMNLAVHGGRANKPSNLDAWEVQLFDATHNSDPFQSAWPTASRSRKRKLC